MTNVDICNQALAHIGEYKITRLDDDAQQTSSVVRYCAEFYTIARQEALAAHRWTFAEHADILVRSTNVLTLGYNFAHQLPTDHLRLLSLHPGAVIGDSIEPVFATNRNLDRFKKVGSRVWSNTEYIAAFYIRDVLNPNEWSPHFRSTVARLLAHYLAGPVSDNPDLSMRHREHYERVDLPNAQFYDAVQDNSGENSDTGTRLAKSPSLQSRGGRIGFPDHDRDYGAGGGGSVEDLDGAFESEL